MRYDHYKDVTPWRDPTLWQRGQHQAEISIKRYHYLCAALQKKYSVIDVPASECLYALFDRKGLTFDAYTLFPLTPVLGLKLDGGPDGSCDPQTIRFYVSAYEDSWKCMEGEIMYWVAEEREFWNMLLNYNSPNATMGRPEWDELFAKLKDANYDKNLVPCMFYARESGCLDPVCPFLHDRASALKAREKVLDDRRTFLSRPTMRDISIRQTKERSTSRPMGKAMLSIEDTTWPCRVAKICSSQDCLKVKWRPELAENREDEVETMMLCSRCRMTNYCSPGCQRADWKRHKKECRPHEEILEDDDLWTRAGSKKGTGHINITFDLE